MKNGATTVELLPLSKIVPAKDNPRRKVGDVGELADSIKAIGLLEPLVVMPQNGNYLLVCGERRLAGAKKAGVKEVPAIVREFDERERIEAMLIENLQREDLDPLEEAEAFSRLVELGHTQRALAKRVGRSQSHVAKRLALLKLPGDVQKKVDSGGITLEDAVALTRLVEHPDRLKNALAGANSYWPVSQLVDRELEAIEKERKLEAAVKKAEAEGLRVIPQHGSDHYWYRPPKGVFKIAKSPNDWETLPLDPKTHAKEPCHAVGIEPRTSERIPLCTDRKRHPKVKTANEKSQNGNTSGRTAAVNEAEQTKARELEEAAAARAAFVRQLLAKRPPKDVLEILQLAIVKSVETDSELACAFLGIEFEDDTDSWNASFNALEQLGAGDEVELARAAAAMALASLDDRAKGYYGPQDGAVAYLGWLERHGYELRPVERKMLEPKKAAAA